MILELRNVASLTEARYAAGEGFTHIRLHNSILEKNDILLIEGIKSFLSGLSIGCNKEVAHLTFGVQLDFIALQESDLAILRYTLSDIHLEVHIIESLGDYEQLDKLFTIMGISLPAPGEEETGILNDYTLIDTILEDLRNRGLC